MTAAVGRFSQEQLIELAARGIGKVDVLGPRGATLCSMDEVIAMAGMLALLGLRPIAPGAPTPDPLQRFFFDPPEADEGRDEEDEDDDEIEGDWDE